jgi:hypothetical protein
VDVSRNGTSLFKEKLLRELGGVKEGSGDVHLFPWRPHWKTWKRVHMLWAYMWKFLGRVSLPIVAPLGNLGRGSVYR